MKKKFGILTLALCLMLGAVGCSNNSSSSSSSNASSAASSSGDSSEKVELNISAAASLQEAMVELEKEFKNINPDVKLTVNLGSSGSLMQQIQEGAPCDLFISAGAKQMDALVEDGTVEKDAVKTLLTNDLVLVAAKGEKVDSLDALKTDDVEKIAIGDPESVPAGKYAKEVLDNTKLYDNVKDKLVLAKDVKEVLSWIQKGNADVGFVYLSDATGVDDVDVVLTTDDDSHSEIAYPVAVLKDSKQAKVAQQFEDFLLSDKAQNILEKHGFNKVK
ncbi:MAG: molybdate ABC transporter substrate-binding protein [Intestinibacter bartlettii]|uniref:molybdate ABC transporter substrate-binding protein n=1 Tax=Intestinibacter bartlettii TaxID=261299 RepID=UPI0024310684|nr:molybdate ABC transporter substrate-binding protein [Intestinibacter bartlettii]MBS7148468.1 molybdate ABC transporter substrate-binding protein [Intestinibacter bartlettii]